MGETGAVSVFGFEGFAGGAGSGAGFGGESKIALEAEIEVVFFGVGASFDADPGVGMGVEIELWAGGVSFCGEIVGGKGADAFDTESVLAIALDEAAAACCCFSFFFRRRFLRLGFRAVDAGV